MKIINITNGAFAALLLASSVAGADSQYPASDFQPKVLYQDADYKHESSSAPAAAPSSTAKPADSKYPAADFQPKVVYSDSNYKHSAAAPSAPSSGAGAVAESSAAPEAKKEESNFIYLIGLAVLAFVGVIFFKKQAQPVGHAGQAQTRPAAGGATGVAKYLNRKTGTGVARYLEQQVKSAAASAPLTGVAKYMASQKPASESASSKPASRVEKYLRDRG
ncbi:hypothetical protein [Methylomicrobium sp. Wu6]|uniref:hypothetical protein n=1 Tax=Methylomicrobium sp. Wu6 TaxID=3107928 RepID=UPI002DD687C8|nr:hypothetical protein [Methylomicrobium sp. Wu6]MEC4749125.1 hypothetical protein [Methylomicrobium sp. Wu6]